MHERLRVGSICTGIGGVELGLERTGGFEPAWFCEVDEFCRKCLEAHWPGVPILGDVTKLSWSGEGTLKPLECDVLTAGFPCQPVSLAGERLGQADPRWLWPHVHRAIRALRPKYVVLENVVGLRSKGLGDVLGSLSKSGYDAEWDCVPASAVGALHRRDRVWVIAYPNGQQLREQPGRLGRPNGEGPALAGLDGSTRPVADAPGEQPQGSGALRQEEGRCQSSDCCRVANPQCPGLQGCAGCGNDCPWRPRAFAAVRGDGSGPTLERELGRGAHGISAWLDGSWEVGLPRVLPARAPHRTERLKALGNAVVPQVAEVIGRVILEMEASCT